MSAEPMDAKTLEALKASIRKWRDNAEVTCPEFVRISSGDCPLCTIFYAVACQRCPVAVRAGGTYCHNTPFRDAASARIGWMYFPESEDAKANWQAAARAEVAFLESLLPEGETA